MALYQEFPSSLVGPTGPKEGADALLLMVDQAGQDDVKLKPSVIQTAKNLKLLDRDKDGEVTEKEIKESAEGLKFAASKLPENKKQAFLAGNEILTKEDPNGQLFAKVLSELGEVKISPQAAFDLQNAITEGVKLPNPYAAVVQAGKDGGARNNAQGLDRDKDGTVTLPEAQESSENLKLIASQMPAAAKKKLLEEYAAKQKSDPDGAQEALDYEKNTGIKMEREAALAAREAKIAGAKLPNPDAAIAAQEAEEEKKLAGKDGKKGKNLLEMIIAIVMKFLGVEEKNEETAVADAKDKAPTGQEQQSAAKGKEKEPELTPQEKQNSLAYLSKLDESIQNSIKRVGLADKVMLADVPKDFKLQVQAGAAVKLQTAETTVNI